MKKYIRLYIIFIKYSFMQAMMYKADFMIWSLVTVGWIFLNFLFYQFLYLNVTEIAGWTKPQLLVLLGFYFVIDFFLWGVLWQNMRKIPEIVNRGQLDLVLTKPVNTQFLLSFKGIGFDDIHGLLIGLVTIVYALSIGNIKPSVADVLLSTAALGVALVYIYSAWFITVCAAFWFDRIENLHYLFPGLRQIWRVPQPFYKGIVQKILTFVIPATLVTTVPAQFLLRKPSLPLFITLIIFAVVSLKLSTWVLKVALRHYSGASS